MAKGTIVMTGANGGLGRSIVSRIAESPELASYHGIYAVHDASSSPLQLPDHGSNTIVHSYDTLSLELSNLASVREVAASINARVATGDIPPIRALILNAGYQELDAQRFTDDGFAVTFLVNYLGHWLLVLLLLQSMDREMGRIVVVASKAHDPHLKQNARPTDPIAKGTWSTFEEDPSWMSGMRRYGAAKLCAIMMIEELQGRLDTDTALKNISVLGIDPGTMPTGIARRSPWFIRVLMFQIIFPVVAALQAWLHPTDNNDVCTVDQSARDMLAGAFDNSQLLGERPKGLYLDGSELAEMSAEAKDPKKKEILWKDSVRYTQLKKGETMLTNWN
ncbi:putative short-chain dehydrogenase [Xylariaceae sp. FL0662B]|nr:putative short-chain dehydrogenase [Xylariaceae sp. FL0662B]